MKYTMMEKYSFNILQIPDHLCASQLRKLNTYSNEYISKLEYIKNVCSYECYICTKYHTHTHKRTHTYIYIHEIRNGNFYWWILTHKFWKSNVYCMYGDVRALLSKICAIRHNTGNVKYFDFKNYNIECSLSVTDIVFLKLL